MLAIGIGRIRPRWFDVDPGDECRIPGQRGLDLVQRGDVALGLLVVLDEPGVEFAQGDARELCACASSPRIGQTRSASSRSGGVASTRRSGRSSVSKSGPAATRYAELSSLGGR